MDMNCFGLVREALSWLWVSSGQQKVLGECLRMVLGGSQWFWVDSGGLLF